MEKIQLELKENQIVEFSNGVVIDPEILKTLHYLQWGADFWNPKEVKNGGMNFLQEILIEVVGLLVRCNNETPDEKTLFSGIESIFWVKRELDQLRYPLIT